MLGDRFLCASTVPDATMHERIRAAAGSGYMGIGLRPSHVSRASVEKPAIHDLSGDLQAHNLELVEIGFVTNWWDLDDQGKPLSLKHEYALHHLKTHYGGHHMMAISGPLGLGDDIVAERFAGLCRRASEHGLKVALEFLPWTDVNTIEKAWKLIEASGEPNAALALDTWHFFRGGSTPEMLEAVPADRIAVIQLSDGPLSKMDDELEATFRFRRLPGEGDFDLERLFRLLIEKGVTAPIGVEVLSEDLRTLGVAEVAQLTGKATDYFLAPFRTDCL